MPGREQRHEHVPEHARGARAEHARRRLEVRVDLLDERRHHQDHERRRGNQVGEDHARHRAAEMHLVEHRRERNAVGDRRHHQRQQEQQHQRALAAEIRGAPACTRRARRSAAPGTRRRTRPRPSPTARRRAGTPSTLGVPGRRPAVGQPGAEPAARERVGRHGGDHQPDVDDEERHQAPQQAAPGAFGPRVPRDGASPERASRCLRRSSSRMLALAAGDRPAIEHVAQRQHDRDDDELHEAHDHRDGRRRANSRIARTPPRTRRSRSRASAPPARPAARRTGTPRTPARTRGRSTSRGRARAAAGRCGGTAPCGSAPSVAAARASTGSMPVMYDRISRNANGKPEMTSEISTPQ